MVTALSIIVRVIEICWQSLTHTADDAQEACPDENRKDMGENNNIFVTQQTTAFLLQQLHPIHKNIAILMYLPKILNIGS